MTKIRLEEIRQVKARTRMGESPDITGEALRDNIKERLVGGVEITRDENDSEQTSKVSKKKAESTERWIPTGTRVTDKKIEIRVAEAGQLKAVKSQS